MNNLQGFLFSFYNEWEFCLLFHNISRIILIFKMNYINVEFEPLPRVHALGSDCLVVILAS